MNQFSTIHSQTNITKSTTMPNSLLTIILGLLLLGFALLVESNNTEIQALESRIETIEKQLKLEVSND